MKTKIAEQYAIAFTNVVKDVNTLKSYYKKLKEFSSNILSIKELKKILSHPIIPFDKKRKILLKLSEFKEYPKEVQNLIFAVVRRSRIYLFDDIVEEIAEIILDRENALKVNITLARKVSKEKINFLVKELEKFFNKKIYYRVSYDPSILGGIVIKTKSEIYDASVKNRLSSLLRKFEKGV